MEIEDQGKSKKYQTQSSQQTSESYSGYSSDDSRFFGTDSSNDYTDDSSNSGEASSSDEDDMKEEISWLKYSRQNILQHETIEFQQSVGISKDIKQLKTPTEHFQLFINDPYFEKLCKFSNTYFMKYKNNKKINQSHHIK